MISKKPNISYPAFPIDQFKFREEGDFNNIFLSLLRKLAGTQWQVSPFKKGEQLTLQAIGKALGLDKDNYKDLLIYHDKRLKLQDSISTGIYFLVCFLLAFPYMTFVMPIVNTYSIYLRVSFIGVFCLYLFISIGVAFRISQFVTLRFFSDSLSIQRSMYIIIELARCKTPITPFQKKKLLGHMNFLETVTRSLIYQYNLSAKTLEWAVKHLKQIESFIQEREKWIIAPRELTLESLQQDFYRLALMYISGHLGDFEYEAAGVDITNDKPGNNIQKFLRGIPRIVIGVLIPILGLLIIALRPDVVANIIDIKVLTLICIGWFLLAIDVILKLGIVSGVIGIAKGIKDLT